MKRTISVICLLILALVRTSAQHKMITKPERAAIYSNTGVINQQGDTIVPFIYNDISQFTDGIACVSELREYGDKKFSDTELLWGFIDKTGKVVVPLIYRSLSMSKNSDRYFATDSKMKKGIIDSRGNIIIPFIYDTILQFNEHATLTNRLFFCKINNEGYIVLNKDGKKVNPNRYTSIQPFFNYQRINYIVELDKKKGLLDYDGKELIPCRYDKVDTHWWWSYKSPIPVAIADKWGFVDSTGVIIVPCEYKDVNHSFSNNILEARSDDKRIVFDLKGNVLLSTPKVVYGKYGDKAFITREAYLTKDHKSSFLAGLVNKEGENITPYMYDQIYRLSDKYFLASLDGKTYGIIDTKGKTIQSFQYTFNSLQGDQNLVWLSKNGKAGLIDTDKKCKTILDFEYDNTLRFDYTLSKNGKWGMFDKQLNKITIPVVYDSISRINWDHKKMYCVLKGQKWGIIDSLNRKKVPIEFDKISRIGHFSWWSLTEVNGKYGLVDNHYRIVLPCKYDGIRLISPYVNWYRDNEKKYVVVSEKGYEGVVEVSDSKASQILPIEYKLISYLGDDFFKIVQDRVARVVDAENNVIITCSASNSIIYSEGVFIVKTINVTK